MAGISPLIPLPGLPRSASAPVTLPLSLQRGGKTGFLLCHPQGAPMLLVPFLAPPKGVLQVADNGADAHPCLHTSRPAPSFFYFSTFCTRCHWKK